nr:low-density lipoprotein receptor class A domain-containing protein 4 isoform X2 [Bubalus bubalis]
MQEAGSQATNAFTECKFTCTSGQCLYLGSLVCNQQNDCGDNSDEENCLLVTEHPPPGIFSCKSFLPTSRHSAVVCLQMDSEALPLASGTHPLTCEGMKEHQGPGNGTCLETAFMENVWMLQPTELEFAQVVVVVVVVTVMVVVIFCLLNHYRASTRSFIHRPGQGQRQEDRPQLTMYAPRSRDGVTAPPFLQRDRFSRFQPTYPYVQHEIDLPPTISLSDGEEPPPYQGPCTLQLRDPEQQMELNRESVRAPPNRTVFDSDLIGVSVYSGGPCPPSSNSGISASTCSSTGRMAGPPPAYSEAMGHYPAATPSHPQHSSAHSGSRLLLQREGPGARSCPTRARTGSPGSASDL